jgi:dihydrofolate reductase
VIKLVVVTDPEGTVGRSTDEGNPSWLEGVPADLAKRLPRLYSVSDLIAIGRKGLGHLVPESQKGFVLSQNASYQPPCCYKKLKVVLNHSELVSKYESSSNELAIIGGASMFRLFLPHAAVLDVIVLKEPLSGDLVFKDWDDGSFDLVDQTSFEGYEVRKLFRK